MSVKNPVTRISLAVLSAITLSVSMTGVAAASNLRSGFNSNVLARNDDSSSGAVDLGFTANFFGNAATGASVYNQVYVNNNGNFTFTAPSGQYTPTALNAATRLPIIAAFLADVDTRGAASSPVTYGRGTVDVGGVQRNAFGANYVNVGYYPSQTNKINDFQLVLIDRADTGAGNFDIEFNYDRIQWETGGASGGSNGLGGSSAHIGYSNGTGIAGTNFELCGSGINGAFLDGAAAVSCNGSNAIVPRTSTSTLASSLGGSSLALTSSSNLSANLRSVGQSSGLALFNARGGAVVFAPPAGGPVTPPVGGPTDPTAVPEPSDLLGTVLAGFAVIGLKRKLSSVKKSN